MRQTTLSFQKRGKENSPGLAERMSGTGSSAPAPVRSEGKEEKPQPKSMQSNHAKASPRKLEAKVIELDSSDEELMRQTPVEARKSAAPTAQPPLPRPPPSRAQPRVQIVLIDSSDDDMAGLLDHPPVIAVRARPEGAVASPAPASGKKRGRPPKESSTAASPAVASAKKRGRPPKDSTTAASPAVASAKKRGRPPKNSSPAVASAKKRGRPPKASLPSGKHVSSSGSKKLGSGRKRLASPAKRTPPRSLPLPKPLPVLTTLSAEAARATLVSWQFARSFAEPLSKAAIADGEWKHPSLEVITRGLQSDGDAAVAAGAAGALGDLHSTLLRFVVHSDGPDGAEFVFDDELPTSTPQPDDSAAGTGDEVPAVDAAAALAAKEARGPDFGPAVVQYADAVRFINPLTWPEVLRLLVSQWQQHADAADEILDPRGRRASIAVPPDEPLRKLAAFLRAEEYSEASSDTRATALEALCERVLMQLAEEVERAGKQLLQDEVAARREARGAGNGRGRGRPAGPGHAAGVEKRQKVAEAWAVRTEKKEVWEKAKTAYNEARLLHTASPTKAKEARAALLAAQAEYDAARAAHQSAKNGPAPAPPPPPALEPKEAAAAENSITERQRLKAEAASLASTKRAEEEKLEKQRAEARRQRQLHDMVRLRSLGCDRDGARYWQLPTEGADTLTATDADDSSWLFVESADGQWGRFGTVAELKRALLRSEHRCDSALLRSLRACEAAVTAQRDPVDDAAGSAAHVAVGGMKLRLEDESHAQLFAAGASHEWVGRRARRIFDGDAFDATIVAYGGETRSVDRGEEEREGEESSTSSKAKGHKRSGAAVAWLLLYDDGDTEVLEEEEAREAIAESEESSVRDIRRALVDAQQLLLQVGVKRKNSSKAPPVDDSLLAWREAAMRVSTVDEAQQLLLQLHQTAYAAVETAAGNGPANGCSGAQCTDTLRQWAGSWRERLALSRTFAQLGLRLLELTTSLHSCDGMRPCTKLQVSVEDEHGKLEWARGIVVAVWPNGSFRALVASEDGESEWAEDFAPMTSREGRKQFGKEWRFAAVSETSGRGEPAQPDRRSRTTRSSLLGSAQLQRRTARRSYKESPPRGEEDEDADAATWSEGSSASSDDSDEAEDEENSADNLEIGDSVEVLQKQGRKRSWAAATVTRVFRGGAFEATFEQPIGKIAKTKLEAGSNMRAWRRPD